MQRLNGHFGFSLPTFVLLVSVAMASAATNVWQGGISTDWFDPGNWSPSGVPTNEAEVLIPTVATRAPTLTNATAALASFALQTNQTLTVMGWTSALSAREMTVGGTITHGSNTLATTNSAGEWIPLHRVWLAGSNITISMRGKIDASYRGYATNAGPGRVNTNYCGAGHSGIGRRGANGGTGGPEYGDPAAPVQLGSGGGLNVNSASGGGAIRIEAAGQLTLDGSLTAHGRTALTTHGSGGSGGSIWLSCRTLAGSTNGLVGVDGGDGNYYGTGAAAGRMAVIYNAAAQAALGTPFPLIRFSGKPGGRGPNPYSDPLPPPMATLYLPDTQLVTSAFSGKRFQYTRWVIPGFTNWAPASLTLNDCIVGLPNGFHLNVAGDLLLTNGGALHLFAVATTNALTVEGALVEAGGNMVIGSNSWIQPYADPTNGAIVKFAVTGDLVVAAGGGFDADYKGYTFCRGPGTVANANGGGAYGGKGAQGFDGNRGGSPYGDEQGPIQAGSGGGQQPFLAGQGGGAIRIVVGDQAVIQGTLTALGSPGIVTHGSGGSGGGISVECRTFEGTATGLLRVDGGLGNYYGGSGGGGRMVVTYDPAAQAALPDPRPPVRFSAYAYPNSGAAYVYPNPAEMGTLYFPDTLLLAASPASSATWGAQRFWHVRLAIPGFTNWAPASLTMSNCVVRFPEGFRLDVAGDLTLHPGAGLRLHASQTNSAAEPYGARVRVGGNMLIRTNAWIYPYAQPTNGALVGVRVEGNATIDAGGGVDADAKGYFPVLGNTNGPGAGRNNLSGGGHGGKGGGTAGGYTNGVASMPVSAGSPGGWYVRGDYASSANGGGGIRLLVGGELTLNGTLTANGGEGVSYGGPGGSGGSILASAGRFSGAGLMRARGGNCHAGAVSGSGGGGRIAVWHHIPLSMAEDKIAQRNAKGLDYSATLSDYTGMVQVEGGTANSNGFAGSSGFYRYAIPGTMILVR